jgi:hypothetical protein
LAPLDRMDEARAVDMCVHMLGHPRGYRPVHFPTGGLPSQHSGELGHSGQTTALDPAKVRSLPDENLPAAAPGRRRTHAVYQSSDCAGGIGYEATEDLGAPKSSHHSKRLDKQDSHTRPFSPPRYETASGLNLEVKEASVLESKASLQDSPSLFPTRCRRTPESCSIARIFYLEEF